MLLFIIQQLKKKEAEFSLKCVLHTRYNISFFDWNELRPSSTEKNDLFF